ncbi:YhgE/Pip domain-containing protein [Piscibacillus sp. B03]|uniref:YhgE/Pip domain-containing protein n=1 Tax=Piscibacillus sp. B03 TaxID=3457430 RepID=UPI003FCEC1DE
MSLKRIIAIITTVFLILPTFLVSATTQNSTDPEVPEGKGNFSEKHEVVYTTLNAFGEQKNMYIVNNFNITEPGKIKDYGPYTKVENLSNLHGINMQDQEVEFIADGDQFYYQGTLDDKTLPWSFDITYTLNGREVTPEELVGQDGQVAIHITTEANNQADEIYYENYLLQISLTLDSERFSNINAPDGNIATAGKNKQVTFTVMPEKNGDFTVEAQAEDFEMEGIELNAMPSSMSIDSPDANDMKAEMSSLSEATEEVNHGVEELKNGIAELNDGVQQLQSGSKDYQDGINQLAQESSELIEGSQSIDHALEEISSSLNSDSGNMNVGELEQLQQGLYQIADGLKETEQGLEELNDNYQQAYQALNGSMEQIPEYNINEDQIQELIQSGADPEVVNQLAETYKAARTAKGIYQEVQQAFAAVPSTLDTVTKSLSEMRANLTTMADELGQSLENMDVAQSMQELQEGLNTLSSNYKTFHSGLVEYTDGVSQLSNSYGDIHSGMTELLNGTHELEDGAQDLHNGTSELADSTADLPEQMQDEIDNMINEYDKSDFEPVSFVSPKNEKVETVQFVIKTDSIKQDEEEVEEAEKEQEKGFWEKLLDLFR